jgi:hypothetical protein
VSAERDRVVLMACGDVNVQRPEPHQAFALVKARLAEADLLFGDLEMGLYRPDATITEKPGWRQSEAGVVAGLRVGRFSSSGSGYGVRPRCRHFHSSRERLRLRP